MRYILPIRERRTVQWIRLFAHSKGKGMIERGVRPQVDEGGLEKRLRPVWWIGRPRPMRENATVQWFEGGGNAQSLVKLTKAPTPQLQMCPI